MAGLEETIVVGSF